METKQYKELISKLFQYQLDTVISNSDASHAIVLLSAIFHYAHDYVYVYCGNLKKEVYGDTELLTEIRSAAYRSVKLNFIVENDPETEDIVKIAKEQPDFIHIYKIKEDVPKPYHFTVSDGKAFRFELDHDGTRALGCANHPSTAIMFDNQFKKMLTYVNAII